MGKVNILSKQIKFAKCGCCGLITSILITFMIGGMTDQHVL